MKFIVNLLSKWNPDAIMLVEDARKISIALIIAGLAGFFVKEVEASGAIIVLLIGLATWSFAIRKRK